MLWSTYDFLKIGPLVYLPTAIFKNHGKTKLHFCTEAKPYPDRNPSTIETLAGGRLQSLIGDLMYTDYNHILVTQILNV